MDSVTHPRHCEQFCGIWGLRGNSSAQLPFPLPRRRLQPTTPASPRPPFPGEKFPFATRPERREQSGECPAGRARPGCPSRAPSGSRGDLPRTRVPGAGSPPACAWSRPRPQFLFAPPAKPLRGSPNWFFIFRWCSVGWCGMGALGTGLRGGTR